MKLLSIIAALLLTTPIFASGKFPGEIIYKNSCGYCHGAAAIGTPLAPVIRGSTLELLRMKVTSGNYPVGYMPKRQTNEMPLFPGVSDEVIVYLYLYLNDGLEMSR